MGADPRTKTKGWKMINALYVALGGAIGAMVRYGINVGSTRLLGVNFPYVTLGINNLSSLAMGILIGMFAMKDTDPALKLFLMTGVLGGFTTFSAFSLETVMLYDRKPMLAVLYVTSSIALSVGACILGMKLHAR